MQGRSGNKASPRDTICTDIYWTGIPFHSKHTFQHLSLTAEMFSQEYVPCTITIEFATRPGMFTQTKGLSSIIILMEEQ